MKENHVKHETIPPQTVMGLVLSIINESFPPKSKFNVEDIPDLSGKVIIVTGANAGKYRSSPFYCPSASKRDF